jgi:glycosyltransferase involved in cell wall biosynthesis
MTWGGAETLLADFATALRDRGGTLTVGYLNSRSQAAERLREQGVEPELVEIKSMLGRTDRTLVREHLRAVSPDLLHTHLGYSDFLGGLAARSLGVPTVATLHVMEWERSLRENTKGRLMALARRRCAARVIAVSEAARRRYLETGWDHPERVVTVHNGIAGERRPGAGPAIRAELGLGPDELVVAMVSVLRPGKGHDVAAQAIGALRERFPKLRLLVLGDGPDREAVLESLRPAGDAVLAPGFRPDVLSVLDGVDVLIQPSRVDALPTALIEAMAAGVPVIASDVGGIPEIVVDGETGILVESPLSGEALSGVLAGLLEDPGARALMGAAGRERFERQFALGPWMDRLEPVYEEAIREQGAGAGLS